MKCVRQLLFLMAFPLTCASGRSADDRLGVCTQFSQNWYPYAVIPLIAQSNFGWIKDDIYWSEFAGRELT
jgi:hypothetical protein